MITFQNILCPIDFSDTAARALSYAAALARWYQSQLSVLHVASRLEESLVPGSAGGLVRSTAEGTRAGITARLQHAIGKTGTPGLHATALVREGHAAQVIVESTLATEADLLVMGTHGLSGCRRLVLGSVTEKVVRTAACPVMTVPPAVGVATPRPILFKKILCPIDHSPSSLKALEYALELGRQAGGSVTVLHVLEYMDPEDALEPSVFDPCRDAALENRRRRQDRIDRASERLHAQLAGESRTWCAIEEVVAINRAYKEILHRASVLDADLIVMGARDAVASS